MIAKNMHVIDRSIRVVLGIFLIWIGFIDQSVISNFLISWALGIFGLVNFVSATVAFCPIYFIVGLSTRRTPA